MILQETQLHFLQHFALQYSYCRMRVVIGAHRNIYKLKSVLSYYQRWHLHLDTVEIQLKIDHQKPHLCARDKTLPHPRCLQAAVQYLHIHLIANSQSSVFVGP